MSVWNLVVYINQEHCNLMHVHRSLVNNKVHLRRMNTDEKGVNLHVTYMVSFSVVKSLSSISNGMSLILHFR